MRLAPGTNRADLRPSEIAARPEPVERQARPASTDLQARPDSGDLAFAVSFDDRQYDAAVVDLERALQNGRGRLDPATVNVVEDNLTIIDQAVDDARRALAQDPANGYLSGYLVETQRRKLDLLRHAASLTEDLN